VIDPAALGALLEDASEGRLAAARTRDLSPLRGVRGVPDGAIARLAAETQRHGGVHLDRDRVALLDLFGQAFEDGLLTIALAAAALPDDPEGAWELGWDLWARCDDPLTADALGEVLLGPSAVALGRLDALLAHAKDDSPLRRRALVAAGAAWLPTPLLGPQVAALRERLGARDVRFVEAAQSAWIGALATTFARDEAPQVRKALRRLLRDWTAVDPAAVVTWAAGVRGGLHRLLGDEVARAKRRRDRPERPDREGEIA
jgi:hypothetical protein